MDSVERENLIEWATEIDKPASLYGYPGQRTIAKGLLAEHAEVIALRAEVARLTADAQRITAAGLAEASRRDALREEIASIKAERWHADRGQVEALRSALLDAAGDEAQREAVRHSLHVVETWDSIGLSPVALRVASAHLAAVELLRVERSAVASLKTDITALARAHGVTL